MKDEFDDWFSKWLLVGNNAYWLVAVMLVFAASLWLLPR